MAATYPLSYSPPATGVSALAYTAPTALTFGSTGDNITTAYRYLLAYMIMFALLWATSKTRLGYAAIYYALGLVIFLLLVTQYRFIAAALAPISSPIVPSPVATTAPGPGPVATL